MRPDTDKPYYSAYEKRYRCVYDQGIKFWSNFPSEISDMKRITGDFLSFIKPSGKEKVIEFGCGEGFMAGFFVEKGFSYTGIDIAESAVNKARSRWWHLRDKASFITGDITDLTSLIDARYDIGIDISCLHMLVLDKDRQNYLKNMWNIISDGGYMLFCRQIYSKNAISAKIESYEEWLRYSGQGVDHYEMREAMDNGRAVTISLPMIAARSRSVQQYRKELENQNFRFVKILSRRRARLSFIVQKR